MNYKNINIEYNSFHTENKAPFGAIKIGESITFRIQVEGMTSKDATLVLAKEGQSEQFLKMIPEENGFYSVVTTSNEPGLYFYYFIINFHDHYLNNTIYYLLS